MHTCMYVLMWMRKLTKVTSSLKKKKKSTSLNSESLIKLKENPDVWRAMWIMSG